MFHNFFLILVHALHHLTVHYIKVNSLAARSSLRMSQDSEDSSDHSSSSSSSLAEDLSPRQLARIHEDFALRLLNSTTSETCEWEEHEIAKYSLSIECMNSLFFFLLIHLSSFRLLLLTLTELDLFDNNYTSPRLTSFLQRVDGLTPSVLALLADEGILLPCQQILQLLLPSVITHALSFISSYSKKDDALFSVRWANGGVHGKGDKHSGGMLRAKALFVRRFYPAYSNSPSYRSSPFL